MRAFFLLLEAYSRAFWRRITFDPLAVIAVRKGGAVAAYWSNSRETANNFGDAVNPLLMGALLGRDVVHIRSVEPLLHPPTLYLIGSILDNLRNRQAIVAGAGFKNSNAVVRVPPLKVIAVRGPLSRSRLEASGVACPTVYCDPALLLPRFIRAEVVSTSLIGVIPHYVDKDLVRSWGLDQDRYKIIDVEQDPRDFIFEVATCSRVISSSLHGVIAAHAYGVPAAWVSFSSLIAGGDFKFRDYFYGMGIQDIEACYIGRGGVDLSRVRFTSPTRVADRVERFLDAFSEVEALLECGQK